MKNPLAKKVAIRIILAFSILGLGFFLPAGTLNYWEGWGFMLTLLVPMILMMAYLTKHDPKLMERRMRMKEKEKEQKLFMIFSWPLFLVTFILPGFDFRYGWSAVPTCLVILAYAVTLFGYYLFFLVMKENSYASRVIEVEKDQKVISSGPYAIVRHPMYVCMLIIYTAMPLALGSYWALLTVIPIPFLLAIRIWGEEKVLKKDLKGYTEYTKKVKFRLIPYIW